MADEERKPTYDIVNHGRFGSPAVRMTYPNGRDIALAVFSSQGNAERYIRRIEAGEDWEDAAEACGAVCDV